MKIPQNEPIFTISVASKLTKLHPRTLMLYEKTGLLKPSRTKTRHRRYSQANIERIKFISYLTREKRINLAGIKALFEALELTGDRGSQVRSQLFPDFKS